MAKITLISLLACCIVINESMQETAHFISPEEQQLQNCRRESNELSNSQSIQITKLLETSQSLNREFETLMTQTVADRQKQQQQLDQKLTDNQKIARDISSLEDKLSRKFDCKGNSFTAKECRDYCTFPYAYDSCVDTPARKDYINSLISARNLNNGLLSLYLKPLSNQKIQVCLALHVVTE